jgi:hypothetical protein
MLDFLSFLNFLRRFCVCLVNTSASLLLIDFNSVAFLHFQ